MSACEVCWIPLWSCRIALQLYWLRSLQLVLRFGRLLPERLLRRTLCFEVVVGVLGAARRSADVPVFKRSELRAGELAQANPDRWLL